MRSREIFFTALWVQVSFCIAAVNGAVVPPEPVQEFRGVWVATVSNIDWPSKRGLTTAEQKLELLALLDKAAQLKLNTIILQVRPQCDALYASSLEPWSEYLTGTMGKAPEPAYDPLTFAIEEAHKRGLELHAWFNPYRALHPSHLGAVAANHISRTHPAWVKRVVSQDKTILWLDPGEREVQNHLLNVILDVVKRYDIDGLQFDDYFYPDQDANAPDFPDAPSWRKFGADGTSREDWRRENVNTFIERVHQSIKTAKPWVKFGISPAGIWRPGHPQQIRGQDAYLRLFADSRKWLMNGWVDYLSPQLYWGIKPDETSFPVLLQWWMEQNPKERHIWPGIAAWRAGQWRPDEIPQQIQIARKQSHGYAFYNANTLLRNVSLTAALEHEIQKEPALVPASTWLGRAPARPLLVTSTTVGSTSSVRATWQQPTNSETVRFWVLQTRSDDVWTTEILPAAKTGRLFQDALPDAVAIRAVDRAGNMGPPAAAIVNPPFSSRKPEFRKYQSPRDASQH